MKRCSIVAIGLMLAATPAVAQQTDTQPAPAQNENCRAGTQNDGQQKPATGDDLSQKLNDCGGVLKAPATGDQEMTAPAPQEGKTPVIKPGEVPSQPPAQ